MKRCLVTGARGSLGREVVAAMSPSHDVVGVSSTRSGAGLVRADLREPAEVRRLVEQFRPDVVIHCAAYREPDFCEQHPDEARRLNVRPAEVFCESLPADAALVFISSDYVFDGDHPPYVEDSPRRPVSVYGQTKVEAEDIVLRRPGSLIVRCPVLAGAGQTLEASGFIGQVVASLRSREPQELDDVFVRFPTWTRNVAAAIVFLLERDASGVFHVSGPTGGTRYGLTLAVAKALGMRADHLSPSKTVLARLAARPWDSQLATDKIRALGFTQLTAFPEVVKQVLASFG